MKKLFLLGFLVAQAGFGADFSHSRAKAVLAFLEHADVQTVTQAANATELGEVHAALVNFSSCRTSINGCTETFFVSQAVQNGDASGVKLVSATVSLEFDGSGGSKIVVKNVATK